MTAQGPKRILALVAHPDDADVHAGGTLARWVDEGHDVRVLTLTSGDKGHDDPAMTRQKLVTLRQAEQRAAARSLGVQQVTFLDFEDGELASAGPRLAEELTRWIRTERPDSVLTLDPYAGAPRYATYQLHPDHRAVGFAVLDAVYFRAPGPLYYPAHRADRLVPHRVREVWLIMGDHHDEVVDITRTFERKLEAVRAHASQWGKHPDLEGFLRHRAEEIGRPHGIPLGEAFKRLVPA